MSDNIDVEMDARLAVTFRHLKYSTSVEVCDYYGQVNKDLKIDSTEKADVDEVGNDSEETDFIEPEGLRRPAHVIEEEEEKEEEEKKEEEKEEGKSCNSHVFFYILSLTYFIFFI